MLLFTTPLINPMTRPAFGENIFLRMHPLQRVLASLLFSLVTFLRIRNSSISPLVSAIILWNVFAFTYLVSSWIILFNRSPEQIRHVAKKEDGSIAFVFTVILVSSFASMITVLILIISKKMS